MTWFQSPPGDDRQAPGAVLGAARQTRHRDRTAIARLPLIVGLSAAALLHIAFVAVSDRTTAGLAVSVPDRAVPAIKTASVPSTAAKGVEGTDQARSTAEGDSGRKAPRHAAAAPLAGAPEPGPAEDPGTGYLPLTTADATETPAASSHPAPPDGEPAEARPPRAPHQPQPEPARTAALALAIVAPSAPHRAAIQTAPSSGSVSVAEAERLAATDSRPAPPATGRAVGQPRRLHDTERGEPGADARRGLTVAALGHPLRPLATPAGPTWEGGAYGPPGPPLLLTAGAAEPPLSRPEALAAEARSEHRRFEAQRRTIAAIDATPLPSARPGGAAKRQATRAGTSARLVAGSDRGVRLVQSADTDERPRLGEAIERRLSVFATALGLSDRR